MELCLKRCEGLKDTYLKGKRKETERKSGAGADGHNKWKYSRRRAGIRGGGSRKTAEDEAGPVQGDDEPDESSEDIEGEPRCASPITSYFDKKTLNKRHASPRETQQPESRSSRVWREQLVVKIGMWVCEKPHTGESREGAEPGAHSALKKKKMDAWSENDKRAEGLGGKTDVVYKVRLLHTEYVPHRRESRAGDTAAWNEAPGAGEYIFVTDEDLLSVGLLPGKPLPWRQNLTPLQAPLCEATFRLH
ncbi:hypothetical protein EYF80_028380 [Liparis tanakae]|uniref:Uncharacterized protein n=1 Tax=Liparis tanakae TaxID=230148 RepID=A0A4Z2H8L5_9TELE|nr:hypothetical protein EYF80_028380 [Liparis tanakae]